MTLDFLPDRPLAPAIEIIDDAIVVPFGRGQSQGIARPAGILYPDGTPVAAGQCYRSAGHPTTMPPLPPRSNEIKNELAGTFLFGGIAYGHFGHALCESTSRLWALDVVDEPVRSVMFFPRREMTWPNRCLGQLSPVTDLFSPIPPLSAIGVPTRVERMIVAPPGFGVGTMVAGCPEYRTFTRNRMRMNGTARGPEKLYISRSKLFRKRGRMFFEKQIEDWLAAEGYEIFHPQDHDVQTQLARYRAAKQIISTDNSALHLAAYVLDETCEVAILKRRPGHIVEDFVRQLHHFAGLSPLVVDHIMHCWSPQSATVRMNEVMTLIDLEKTARDLASGGFIQHPAAWSNPDQGALEGEISGFEERIEEPLKMVV